jgi:hypothetical protein
MVIILLLKVKQTSGKNLVQNPSIRIVMYYQMIEHDNIVI